MLSRHDQGMAWIDRIFIHEDQKAVVAVDLHTGLLPIYYRAEDARFAHAVRISLCVDWLFIFCY
jgi:hypothetical protein